MCHWNNLSASVNWRKWVEFKKLNWLKKKTLGELKIRISVRSSVESFDICCKERKNIVNPDLRSDVDGEYIKS